MDGQGIAHPRGLGLAAHLGLVLELPTIGLAKSRLVGEGPEPGFKAGSASELIWQGKVVGLILRTVSGRKPLYLSPGHLITLKECREIGLGCVTKYRIPLPLRQADLLSRRLRAAGSWSARTSRCARAWAAALNKRSRYNGQMWYWQLVHCCLWESHSHQRQFSQTPLMSRFRQIRPASPKSTISPSPPSPHPG